MHQSAMRVTRAFLSSETALTGLAKILPDAAFSVATVCAPVTIWAGTGQIALRGDQGFTLSLTSSLTSLP